MAVKREAQKIGYILIGSFFILVLFIGGIVCLTRLIIGSAPSNQKVAGEQVSVEWTPEEKEALAKFLAKKGAVLYYSHTCPHCEDQLEEFGKAQQYLAKIDCATPDGSLFCTQEHIYAVPTWKYKGQVREGPQSLDELAEWVGFKK